VSITHRVENGVADVVIDYPPVNALGAAPWFSLADTLHELSRSDDVHAVVLRAEGRGFCAGVDIKELAAAGAQGMVNVNRACAAAFAAVYDCRVPVIAAVHGFCLGGGIGLVANADIIVASTDATFGLPEVDRGALGAATHLGRLVPHHRMRAMYYTASTATAEELHQFGSVLRVVTRDELVGCARGIAVDIASRNPLVIRLAKEAMNGIDPIDVRRSYRFEQGSTFELTLRGASAEAHQEFLRKSKGERAEG
jgi:enoyl-CoA hydratase